MDDPSTTTTSEGFGLMFYNARWYDPCIMQFNQPDTLIPDLYNPLDLNRYSYVRYNPIRYSDPSGHRPDDGCRNEGGCNLSDLQKGFDAQDAASNAYDPTGQKQKRNREIAEAIIYGGTELAASVFFEPADWAFTAYHCANGDCSPLMLLGVLPIIPTSVGSHGDDVVDLYRAVGPDELADIEKTGIFRVDQSGKSFSTGKWFATTVEDATKWGEAMSSWDKKGFSVIQAAVSKRLLGKLDFVAKLDGIGPAYFVPSNLLKYFTIVK